MSDAAGSTPGLALAAMSDLISKGLMVQALSVAAPRRTTRLASG
jgi:hypothetical protein